MSVLSNTESVVSVRGSRRLGERLDTAGAVLGAGFIMAVGGGYLLAPQLGRYMIDIPPGRHRWGVKAVGSSDRGMPRTVQRRHETVSGRRTSADDPRRW